MVNFLKLPNGSAQALHFGSGKDAAEAQRVINARHAFVVAYAKSKGWPTDPEALTIAQILEARAQDGWKNP